MRDVSTPVATNASSSVARSSAPSEFASLVVPNTASPQFCESSHWQCAMKRSLSGEKSAPNGVTTGARTPRIRWVMIFSESDGCGGMGQRFHENDPFATLAVPPSIRHPQLKARPRAVALRYGSILADPPIGKLSVQVDPSVLRSANGRIDSLASRSLTLAPRVV